MKLKLALLVGLFAFGYALSASAGAVVDTDGDLVPNQFDDCSAVANGPNQTGNQIDSDLDGYGNRCDTDYDNSLTTNTLDFAQFLGTFGTANLGETDADGSGTINTLDFAVFLGKFSAPPGAPGPSGLACANVTPCTP